MLEQSCVPLLQLQQKPDELDEIMPELEEETLPLELDEAISPDDEDDDEELDEVVDELNSQVLFKSESVGGIRFSWAVTGNVEESRAVKFVLNA